MCIHCKFNLNQMPKVNESILVVCRDTGKTYCTDYRYDKRIQNYIGLIPCTNLEDKAAVARTILKVRTAYYNRLKTDYFAQDYLTDLQDFINVFNYNNCNSSECYKMIDLLKEESSIRDASIPIINKIKVRKRNFTRFKKKYQWVNSKFYKLIKKIF